MDAKLKHEIEDAVSQMMTKFLKEQMGEQAEMVDTHIVGETIIVRFKGVLSPAERHMVNGQEGMKLIKALKERLIERATPLLVAIIKDLTKAEGVDVHSSFDAKIGERMVIFTLDKNLEKSALMYEHAASW